MRYLLSFLCLSLTLALPTLAQSDVVIENQTIPSGTYEASNTSTSQNATVASGSSVTFKAG